MSSLIPERHITISPALAATIGLEEAVMLQALTDISVFTPANTDQGYTWYQIDLSQLQTLLPFWQLSDLQRIGNSLADKGIIFIGNKAVAQSDTFRFAMNEGSEPAPPVTTSPKQPAATAPTTRQRGASLLPRSWQPDEDMLQLLTLNHAIPRDFSLAQLEDFVLYWTERSETSHAWSNKFRQHVLKEWRRQQGRQLSTQPTPQDEVIGQKWHPSQDALEILHRNGVSQDFIEEAIPEFILYWRERGVADSTWNSKFIAHIRRQWHKYTLAIKHDYEPQQIPANWRPSEDLFDIIKLANIERDFADALIPEFVLFWRDSGEIQRSWNSKFLQHVKYQWATRHNLGQQHAGQQTHTAGGKATEGFIEKHTDRSWREGL